MRKDTDPTRVKENLIAFFFEKFPIVEKYGLIWTSIFSRDERKANFPNLHTWILGNISQF